ncbi:hypothetical protein BD310DRAFT_677392 [Dichomitus squalens]|uniref:F-box domain-containing protein n=1 Tax=Dichomitus squalens TaxID=114155 RepID=A0A4Q9PN38_9APHY|nr:hypothetical protein BD310DRAFT_677392 [Dichomitus squalens]
MSKHSLSPASLPPSKRLHTIGADGRTQDPQPQSIFDELFDELILFIFSYLSHTDLCNIQRTNRNWSRLSLDNQSSERLRRGDCSDSQNIGFPSWPGTR